MSERMTDERLTEINTRHDGGRCDSASCWETCELLAALKAERSRVAELEVALFDAMEWNWLDDDSPTRIWNKNVALLNRPDLIIKAQDELQAKLKEQTNG